MTSNADGSDFYIYCNTRALEQVKHAVEKLCTKIEEAEVEWVAKNSTSLTEEQTNKAYEFLSSLQDHEDVKNVYSNLV